MVGATSTEPPPVAAERAHAAGNRLRLRLSGSRDPAQLEDLATRISACPGVLRVRIRPNTGSAIIEGEVPAETLAARIEGAGILRLRMPGHPPPIGKVMQLALMRADMTIKARSQGVADLRSALAVLLFAGSLVQTARGRLVGPASTLALGALSLIDRGGGGAK